MYTLYLLVCLIIFLFTFYAFARDDFLFLKKNISLEQLFNTIFVVAFAGLFFARIAYVAFHFNTNYLNPLVFFLFPYFPGLSLSGGVLGGAIFMYFYLSSKKIPLGRSYDFFALSLLATIGGGMLLQVLSDLFHHHMVLTNVIEAGVYLLLFVLFVSIVLPHQRRGELQDGSVALMFFTFFSLVSVLIALARKVNLLHFLMQDGSIFLCLLILSLILFLKQEKVGTLVAKTLFQRSKS